MTNYNNIALNWAEEDIETSPERVDSEMTGVAGGNFWRSVWKRIEHSDSIRESSPPLQDVVPEPPRDYVVENFTRQG